MRNSGTALMGHIESVLVKKCSLLDNYIYLCERTVAHLYTPSSGEQMYKVMDYFRSKMR